MQGTSPIVITAALSIAGLLAAAGMQFASSPRTTMIEQAPLEPIAPREYLAIEDADANGIPDWQDELASAGIVLATTSATTTLSDDPISSIAENIAASLYGGYLSLKQYDEYTPTRGEQLASTVASALRAPETYTPHMVHELILENDTSETEALEYRARMRVAVAPMVTDDPPEVEFFARYLETRDPSWLDALAQAAARYGEVEKNLLAVSVPKDAAPEHLRALNAIGLYGNTLERLSHFGDDSLASLALLKTQNDTEKEMLLAFDSLAKYYVRKVTN